MSIPSATHKAWKDIVTGDARYHLQFLAAKVLLGKLNQSVEENPSMDNIAKCISQLHALYSKNANMPLVKKDLKTIFGE